MTRYRSRTGHILGDAEMARLAAEAERGYEVTYSEHTGYQLTGRPVRDYGPTPLTRVYRRGDPCAHLREDVAPGENILCRRYDDQGDPEPGSTGSYSAERWLGTGSQDEYEDAAALPLCAECEARS